MLYLILTVLLFALSFLSGMMGLGVAFIATPVLGLFGFELKHQIMPLSLWLNGLTAIAGAVAFARKGMVDWRTAIPLLIVTTLVAPIGVWLLQFVSTTTLWWLYVAVLVFLAYRMAFPPKQDDSATPRISDAVRARAGSTIPVKFQLKQADGTIVQAGSLPQWLTPQKGGTTTAPIDENVYSDPATSGATFRWDSTSQQYSYNWSTKGSTSSYYYRISVILDDGQTCTVDIGLR